MARTEEDIFEVLGEMHFRVSLDRERMELDPVWKHLNMIYGDYPSMCLEAYLDHYTERDSFLRDCPATNGPGQLQLSQIEKEPNGIDGSNNGSDVQTDAS
jgi:hypothetical protein